MNPRTSHEQQHPPQWPNQMSDIAQAEPPEPLPAHAGRDRPMTSAGTRSTERHAYRPSSPDLHTIPHTAASTATALADPAPALATSSFDSLPDAEQVTIPIVIDAGLVMPLRRAVRGGHDASAQVLRIEPIPRSNDVKVLLALTRSTVDGIMVAIIRSLPSAMFGRISSA